MTYLDDNDLLVDEQNGFRSERSCMDHVFTLNSIVKNRNSTFVTFLDLKKAFDMVDRELLEYSLIKNGVDGHFYQAVKSLYRNTESCVRLGNHYTDWFGCTSGVKQGDNLSPTLFALFINDLAIQLKDLNNGIEIGSYKLNVLLYADDIALIAQNEAEMDVLLDTVSKWCTKWRLCINPTKSKVIHFRKKQRKRSDHIFKIGENCLEYSPSYKYLGVLFDEFSTFKNNSENLAKSGGRALGAIISKIHTNKSIGFKTFEKVSKWSSTYSGLLQWSVGM
jgi:hypothetical protein